MNLSYIFDHGDPVLITTFLLLISMSVASWYVIFWKLLTIKIEQRRLAAFHAQYATSTNWPKHALPTDVNGCVGALLGEVEALQRELPQYTEEKSQQLLTVHLSQRLDNIRVSLDRGLTILASVGSSAPFIGLFGTVWGIYGALTDIATKGNASLNIVAGPMGEALVATAVGLFAAIPAVLAYNAFARSNRVLIQQLRHISEQLTLYVRSHEAARTPAPIKLAAGE